MPVNLLYKVVQSFLYYCTRFDTEVLFAKVIHKRWLPQTSLLLFFSVGIFKKAWGRETWESKPSSSPKKNLNPCYIFKLGTHSSESPLLKQTTKPAYHQVVTRVKNRFAYKLLYRANLLGDDYQSISDLLCTVFYSFLFQEYIIHIGIKLWGYCRLIQKSKSGAKPSESKQFTVLYEFLITPQY